MSQDRLVVIGSGPAGVAAALGYREAGGTGAVNVVSADVDLPYERPPLSKDMLRGASEPADAMLHPASFYAERGIELILGAEVCRLDWAGQEVGLRDGRAVGFASCILATGATPIKPPIPGADLPNVYVLRSQRDGTRLRDAAGRASRAVVAGSGFIGCEAAASLAKRGLAVTLITDEDRPHQARLGGWVADRITDWLQEQGVQVVTGDGLAEITNDGVRTASGRVFVAELVLLATGVRPQIALATDGGLRVEQGRVRADASMRTSVADVYAVGDAALATHARAGRAVAVEHWGDALTMGEIAGRSAAGESAEWSQAPGFWSTIGDHTMKHSAWGDGYDEVLVDEGSGEGFTVWYSRAGRVVGVLTHQADDDYEHGQQLVEQGAPLAYRRGR